MHYRFLFLAWLTAQTSIAAPDRSPSMVDGEYHKTHEDLVKSYEESRDRIWTLEQERQDVLARCLQAVSFYREGEKELSRYEKLIPVRYLDSSGRYEERLALTADDVKNLNALIEKYLNAKPIPERVSVRRARKLITRALDELDDLISENRFPHESAISELEIIGKELEDAENSLIRVQKFAKRLGLELDRSLASVSENSAESARPKAEKTPTQPGAGWLP